MKLRINKYIVLGLFALFIAACDHSAETIISEVAALRASSILNADSVSNYLEKYKDNNKDIAGFYFTKATELEATNLSKAIYNIKRSITLYPTKKAYLKLIDLLEKNGDRNFYDVESAYKLLLYPIKEKGPYLFEKPDEKLVCNCIIDDIMYNNTFSYDQGSIPFLCEQTGFNITELKSKVLSDKRLKLDTTSEAYKNIILQFLSDSEITIYLNKPSSFLTFLKSIQDTASLFTIDKNAVCQFDYSKFRYAEDGPEELTLSTFYINYLKEKKDKPDGYFSYNLEHLIKVNDSITAIIYSIDTSVAACPKEMRHIYHRLTTYNKNGKIIATDIVANQSGDELATVKFNHNKYTVTHYKRYWEKPYIKGDFDNYLVKTEQLSTSEYEIKADGAIARVFDSTKQESAL